MNYTYNNKEFTGSKLDILESLEKYLDTCNLIIYPDGSATLAKEQCTIGSRDLGQLKMYLKNMALNKLRVIYEYNDQVFPNEESFKRYLLKQKLRLIIPQDGYKQYVDIDDDSDIISLGEYDFSPLDIKAAILKDV